MTEHPFKDLDAGLRKAWTGAIRERWGGSLVQQQEVAHAIADYLEATAPPPPREPGWYELDFGPRAGVLRWDGEHWLNALTETQEWSVTEAVAETAVRLVPDV